MYNKTKRTFVMLLLVALILAGCGTSMIGKTYDTLKMTALIYDAGMSYAGDEYKAGRMSEAKKAQIIQAADRYKLAVETGTKALKAYIMADLQDEDLSNAQYVLKNAMDAIEIAREALEKYIRMEGD